MTANPKIFEDKINKINESMTLYGRRSVLLSVFRFITFILAAGSLIWAIVNKAALFYFVFALSMTVFVILCIIHGKVTAELNFYEALENVNARYIARIKGDFNGLFDLVCRNIKRRDEKEEAIRRASGTEFYVEGHGYCMDLDLFGKKSLFSLLNVSETAFGRRAFAKELLGNDNGVRSASAIKTRQEAVKELSENPDFLEKFQATALLGKMKKDPKALIDFASERKAVNKSHIVIAAVQIFLWFIPVASLFFFSSYVRACVLGVILVNLLLWAANVKANSYYFKAADGMPNQVSTIHKMYSLLESSGLKNGYLRSLIAGKEGKKVTTSLSSLSFILFFAGLRSQPLFAFLINSVFPLDHLICYFMGKWADSYGDSLYHSITNLAEIESLMCASQISFVSAVNSFPEVESSDSPDKNAYFDGKDITHPLLSPDTAVSNSVTIRSDIALITGSNMSGKTTLIRTVGVCSILAYMGSKVPCSSLSLGRMRIMSSMRITDNLGEDMSTFKAELVRISEIIKCAKQDDCALLFLIDEIFRGTNSDDRTEGALIVLKNLSKPEICGFMTTHDYAMIDKTVDTFKNICYYHFSETYTDSGITFDYRLADGISRESNARYLMRLVGIE